MQVQAYLRKGTVLLKESKAYKGTQGERCRVVCEMCEQDKMEEMISCIKCKTWIHSKCSGVGNGVKKFFCSSCK